MLNYNRLGQVTLKLGLEKMVKPGLCNFLSSATVRYLHPCPIFIARKKYLHILRRALIGQPFSNKLDCLFQLDISTLVAYLQARKNV
jgi:hypothetical protein